MFSSKNAPVVPVSRGEKTGGTGGTGGFSHILLWESKRESAWLKHAYDGYPREMWGGSRSEKWITVGGREEYLAYIQKQVRGGAPVHSSINIAGVPDSGYGVYWVNKILLELDGPNREASCEEMRRMVAFLNVNFGAEPRVYFSGNRSFHVYVDFLPLVLHDPEEVLGDFARRLQKAVGGLHLDFQVFTKRHLARVPWTPNEKTGELCLPVDPLASVGGMSRPEHAVDVQISYCEMARDALARIDSTLASEPRPKPRQGKGRAPQSYEWVELLLQRPITDGRHRMLWHIFSPYLINVRKLQPSEAESILRDYFEKCGALKPLEPSRSQFFRDIRNYIRIAVKDGFPPWRLETIQRKDPQLFESIKEGSH